ncbi:MAG: GAF domain-containing protein [Magnetococcales bacterium]|nr:GAF domain-containing protein [Magnetococcales bacterium]
MMTAVKHWLLLKPRQAVLLVLVLALLTGFLASHLYHTLVVEDFQILLDGQAQREAARLEMETMRGQAMGVASLFGLNEPLLKELALGKRPPNDPEGLARMKTARIMLAADGIYIMNSQGKIVVHETDHESSVGKNIQFRPYWQQAMAGKENVYLAVGSKSGERGIYVADAIREGTSRNGAIIGVVVIKLLGEQLDQRLTGFGVKAILLSPQGVVFASTEEEWLFSINGTPTPTRIEAITRLNQFGKTYENGGLPVTLPFDLSKPKIWIDHKRHVLSRAVLRWNDPAGDWSLLLLGDLEPVIPASVMVTIGLSAGAGLFFLLLVALRAFRESHARHDAVAKTQDAAEKLVAEVMIKSRQAEVGAALQQARSLPDLAQAWFKQLSGFLAVHQAVFYVLENDRTEGSVLMRVGRFGDDQAPERIALGEGLLGQCARDRQPLSFDLPPDGFWRIGSSLGDATPRVLLILPILRSERLLGILQLSSLDPDFLGHRLQIEELTPLLASNLEILLIARKTEETLAGVNQVEAWFMAVFDGIPDPVLVVSDPGEIILANRAASREFGHEGALPDRMPVSRLLPNGLTGTPGLVSALHADQTPFQVRVSIFPVPPHPRLQGGTGLILRRHSPAPSA